MPYLTSFQTQKILTLGVPVFSLFLNSTKYFHIRTKSAKQQTLFRCSENLTQNHEMSAHSELPF